MALGKLGRLPIHHHINQRMLNYWAKLVNGSENKIIFRVYSVLKKLHTEGTYTSKWLDKIHSELNKLGLSYLWHYKEFDPKWFKKKIRLTSEDQRRQNWLETLTISSLCRNYKLFKADLKIEPYLLNIDKQYSIHLCRFRAGNHKLPVTVGRYSNVDIEDRLCKLCTRGEIGDETHYILKCPYFEHERCIYLKPYYMRGEPKLKISELFKITDPHQLRKLARFIQHIMSKLAN